ncbi:MAG: DUF4115 domain-containing protein [bacterium]|nr:DUF4115 domain-containing protein [bacterium]
MKKTLTEALVNERKKKDIKLEQIAQKTNISLKSLQALENGDFDRLPGTFYFKNYIKSYLKAINGNEKVFFETYSEVIDEILMQTKDEGKGNYYSKLRYMRFKKRNIIFTFIFILLLIILAAFLFFTTTGKNIIFGKMTADSEVSGGTSPPVIPPANWKLPTVANQVSMDYSPVRVDISFLKNCWLQAYRGDVKIIEKVFKAGEKAMFKGYRVQVTVGNPSGVRFYINNREVTYLKNLARSERLDISPASMERILEK